METVISVVIYVVLVCGILFLAKRIKEARNNDKYDGRVEPRRPPSNPK